MLISYSQGPASNTALQALELTWVRFAKRLTRPTVGPKDGSYILRGDGSPKRCNANLTAASVVVFDADHGIEPETGELLAAPPASEGAAVLTDAGLGFVLHTTASHTCEAPRWRVYVSADRPYSADECEGLTQALWWRLHREIGVAWSSESATWSQAFYLPRIRSADAPFESYASEGDPLPVDRCLAWWNRRKAAAQVRTAVRSSPGGRAMDALYGGRGKIERFNADHDLVSLLKAHGYVEKGRTTINGEAAVKLLHPGSESGIAGLFVYRHKSGKLVCYSHNGGDPLHTGSHLDAYDVARILGAV